MAEGSLFEELKKQQISELSHAELLRSMSLLYDHMPCCAKLIDEEAYLLSMGAVGRELMEVDDFSGLRGICWLDVWKGEYNAKALEAFEQAKREGRGQFEGFAFTAKRTPKWWRVTLLRVELGGKRFFFSLSEDITSEKGYDAGLDEDTTPSQSAALAEGVHLLELDNHGEVVSGHEETMRALHAKPGELFFGRLFAPVYARLMSEIEEGKKRIRLKSVMCRVGNKLRRVSMQLDANYSIEGERIGWTLEITDQSIRGTVRKELDVLYRMAPGLIMTIDEQARVMTANPAATKILGNHMAHTSLTSALSDTSRQEFEQAFERLKQDPEVKEEECWLRFTTGDDERWFMGSLIYVAEEKLCYIYAVDMTRQREVEERLREVNRTLTDTNQHLEALHHISHHNVQEPIRKILIHADRVRHILESQPGGADPLLMRSVHSIGKIAEAMRTQLYALIAYTNTQRYELELREHELGDLFDAAVQRFGDEYEGDEQAHIDASYECAPLARDVALCCDEEMVTLMFYYLIDNAHKFSRPGHQVRVRVEAERADDRVRVRLRDEGIGVEPRFLERILRPFQKLDRDKEGHGMGLAICQKIMQGHEGKLSVESAGEGHGFEVRLDFMHGVH